jgi:putative multiple sugar transport system permease protein
MRSGFLPDAAAGVITAFNLTSFVIGAAVTALVIYFNIRERRGQQEHGLVEEPFVFFVGRNLLVAAGFLLFSYLMASYKGLPNVLIVMFALIVLYAFVTSSMTIGRRIYALGGNEKAARLSGIKTHRLTFYTFANMGLLAGLAGLIFAARLNTATPKAGLGFELDVIAACFIGGASASGGVGKVVGAVIGAFVMGVMNNGMSILGIGIDLQQMIKGLVLLAAVFLDVYYKNKA